MKALTNGLVGLLERIGLLRLSDKVVRYHVMGKIVFVPSRELATRDATALRVAVVEEIEQVPWAGEHLNESMNGESMAILLREPDTYKAPPGDPLRYYFKFFPGDGGSLRGQEVHAYKGWLNGLAKRLEGRNIDGIKEVFAVLHVTADLGLYPYD